MSHSHVHTPPEQAALLICGTQATNLKVSSGYLPRHMLFLQPQFIAQKLSKYCIVLELFYCYGHFTQSVNLVGLVQLPGDLTFALSKFVCGSENGIMVPSAY